MFACSRRLIEFFCLTDWLSELGNQSVCNNEWVQLFPEKVGPAAVWQNGPERERLQVGLHEWPMDYGVLFACPVREGACVLCAEPVSPRWWWWWIKLLSTIHLTAFSLSWIARESASFRFACSGIASAISVFRPWLIYFTFRSLLLLLDQIT